MAHDEPFSCDKNIKKLTLRVKEISKIFFDKFS